MRRLDKTELLILDDWGLYPLEADGARDIFDILEDRSHSGSVIIVSQIPVSDWYDLFASPTNMVDISEILGRFFAKSLVDFSEIRILAPHLLRRSAVWPRLHHITAELCETETQSGPAQDSVTARGKKIH